MARRLTKNCLGCGATLSGRRDAKTCSATCRKRYQRAAERIRDDLKSVELLNESEAPNLINLWEKRFFSIAATRLEVRRDA